MFYDAKTKSVTAFNGSGRSPANLTIDHVRSQGVTGSKIPATNLNSVTVPGMRLCCSHCRTMLTMVQGCAAAWVDTVEKLGSGNLTMETILEPAIRLAEGGCVFVQIFSKCGCHLGDFTVSPRLKSQAWPTSVHTT